MVILKKHPYAFLKLYFSPYNFTFRSLFNFLKLQLGHFLNNLLIVITYLIY
jgi:hypothetical protein